MIKKIKVSNSFWIFAFLSCCLLLVTSACSNSLQGMLDEYNSNFTPAKEQKNPPKPGDDNFDESSMLNPSYYICTEGSVNLCAPESASYSWSLINSQKTDVTNYLSFYNPSNSTKQDFRFYLPDSYPLLEPGTYQIKLEVTDSAGNSYKDSAMLVIYEQL